MNLIKIILLGLVLAFSHFLPASALTATTTENYIWEIFNIGYEAPTAEETDPLGLASYEQVREEIYNQYLIPNFVVDLGCWASRNRGALLLSDGRFGWKNF